MNEFIDTGSSKNYLYITPDEIFQVHRAIDENIEILPKATQEVLNDIFKEHGSAPKPGNYASGSQSVIRLQLSIKRSRISDTDDGMAHLFQDTKRMVMIVLKFATGAESKTLMDILEEPSSQLQEDKYEAYVQEQEALSPIKFEMDTTSPVQKDADQRKGSTSSPGTDMLPVYYNPDRTR